MRTNPFDTADGEFLAVVNEIGQWSLWPAHLEVPAGWSTGHGPVTRQEALDHIESRWADIRVVVPAAPNTPVQS